MLLYDETSQKTDLIFANLDVIFILKYFCLLFLNGTQKLHIKFKQINKMLYPIDLNFE